MARVLAGLLVFPIALALVFVMVRITGNPIEASLGDRISDAELMRRIAVAGLDRPVVEQFVGYFQSILNWDLGRSFKNQDVNELIWRHITASVEVTLLGLILLALATLVFGALAAWGPGGPVDRLVRGFSIVSYSLPGFLIAVLVQVASRNLVPDLATTGRLPLMREIYWKTEIYQTGFVTVDAALAGDSSLLREALSHLLLPAIALAFLAGTLIRIYRDSLVHELNSPEIQSALSRAIPESRIFFKHALVPALPAALAAFGITTGSLITGVVFVERVFEIRGLGYLLVEAVLARDFMVVQGIFIVTFLLVALINLLVDLLVLMLDRRQRSALL